MSIRKSSSQTAVNTGVAAAVATTINKITTAPSSAASGVAGVTISNVAITDSTFANVLSGDTAVSSAGGFVRVTGTNFRVGANVFLNNVLCAYSLVSSTQINANIPASSNGTYTFAVFNTDGTGGVWVPGLAVSGPPSWTQTSYTATSTTLSIQLLASGDAPLTYYIQPGSNNPQNLAVSSTGLLTGVVPADGSYSITVIVDDAQNQSVQATITVAVSTTDPYFNLTTLALPADTGANVWINDASTNTFNLTVNGDTRPTKFSPYWTQWAVRFNSANTDHLALPFNSVDVAANNFALEAWVYVSDRAGIYTVFNSQTNASTASGSSYGLNIQATNGFLDSSWYVGGGTYNLQGTTAVPLNQWNHCALVRTGGTMSIYLNGVRQATRADMSTNAINAGSASYQPYIGRNGNFYPMNGFISDFRIIIGTHPYDATSASLTVPTSRLTAVTNTAVLTCNSGRFVDTNTQAAAKTITVVNTPQVTTFAPFSESDQNIGSGYFDGTGDDLSIATNTAFADLPGDFTIECWFYASSTSNMALAGTAVFNSSGYFIELNYSGAGRVSFVPAPFSNRLETASSVYSLNTWNHIAVVRSGTTITIYINGTSVVSGTRSVVTNTQPLTIGQAGNGWDARYYFNGYISDFRIIKGTALYTTSFTPPTALLPAVANTSLLTLQYPLGENNHRFVDESTNRFIITRNGNTTQGTFSPFSQTGWGNYFNGSSNLNLSTQAVLNVGTGNFTFECFAYFPNVSSSQSRNMIFGPTEATFSSGLIVTLNGATQGTSGISVNISGTSVIIYTTAIPPNTWHHIAVVREGTGSNQVKLYLNGTNIASGTGTGSLGTPNYNIGRLQANDPAFDDYYTGYLSNIRITNAALYTGNFTPSTTPLTTTVSAGTVSLLTCQSNRFVDNSTNAFAITVNGTPSVQAFSPFYPTAAYSAATNGGSGYFDGTGDYLTLPSSSNLAFGTGDFCVEFWLYRTGTTGGIFSNSYSQSGGDAQFEIQLSANKVSLVGWNAVFMTGATTINANTWYHIAVVRSGTSMAIFVNGARDATATSANNFSSTNPFLVGVQAGGSGAVIGYISSMRAVKGSSVYNPTQTTLTIPTSPLTAITNTSLLLNFTNAGIQDATGKNTLEAVADARVSRVQSKFGGSSMAFDGTGDYLVTPSSPVNILGSGDFTIEFWAYPNNTSAAYRALVASENYAATTGGWSVYQNGASIEVWLSTSTQLINATSALTATTWQHVALSRASGTVRLFVNGTSIASASNTAEWTGQRIFIGDNNYAGTDYFYNGYIDDLRVTRGFARYTANFTPPTETFRLR